ncbi:TagK domain-containing protein [Variovorax humicola]|uniref:TagK domain-containing protein n=1 Tax=Variovorax humicola TaxID=1769758 RepID=A0ABU8W2G3_9BURK
MNDTPAASEAPDADFDLRELAHLGDRQQAQALDDPFGVLDIAGARSRPGAGPLADLLGEQPPRAAAAALNVASLADATSDVAAAELLAGDSTERQQSVRALFDDLHAEFTRVVRDQAQLTGAADWEGASAPEAPGGPSLEELSRDGEKYPMLRDILRPRDNIDKLFDGFVTLDQPMPLAGKAPPEPLQLFAPEPVLGTQLALPSLTRREHHALSPDSHMPMTHGRPADKESDAELEPGRNAGSTSRWKP